MQMKTENIPSDFLKQRTFRTNSFWEGMVLVFIVSTVISCVSLDSTSYKLRIKAVNKITDQNILLKVVLEDPKYEVQLAAFNKISDPALINRLAVESKEPNIRELAIPKVTDQNLLFKLVLNDNNSVIKTLAFNNIIDQKLIERIASECKDQKFREQAINKIADQDFLYKIALEDINIDIKVAAMSRLTPALLAKLATDIKGLQQKLLVIYWLNDQNELMNVSQNNDNWDVRKAAFRKLNDNSLEILAREAKDPALILSAKIRLGQITWNDAFTNKNGSIGTLNHVVGAAAIVDSPQPTSKDVVSACHRFIMLGDASRIPELIYLLNTYGDVSLAEDYMNCGESSLEAAGCSWGRARGYTCTTGYGSNRVRWGSNK